MEMLNKSNENQGSANIGSANILLSATDTDGNPITGLDSNKNIKYALYNPSGENITTILTFFQLTPDALPGTYSLDFSWDTALSWVVNNTGKQYIWEGPYDGRYLLVVAISDSSKNLFGQDMISFYVKKD